MSTLSLFLNISLPWLPHQENGITVPVMGSHYENQNMIYIDHSALYLTHSRYSKDISY